MVLNGYILRGIVGSNNRRNILDHDGVVIISDIDTIEEGMRTVEHYLKVGEEYHGGNR